MENGAKLKRTLKLWQIVMMGLAYMTPMVVFDTFGIVSGITGGTSQQRISLHWWVCFLQPQAMGNL